MAANASANAKSMLKYRRLSKESRTAAGVEFVDRYTREPDPTKQSDIEDLVIIGKACDQALK